MTRITLGGAVITRRTAGIAGIAVAILSVVGVMSSKIPGGPDTDKDIVTWFQDGQHRTNGIIAAYLFGLLGLALLALALGLSRAMDGDAADGDAAVLARVGGALSAAAAFLIGSSLMSMVGSIVFQDGGRSNQQVATLGWVTTGLLTFALPFALIPLMVAVARAASTPAWLTWISWIAAVGMLAAVAFFPLVLIPIWAVSTGVHLLRQPTMTRQSAGAPAPA